MSGITSDQFSKILHSRLCYHAHLIKCSLEEISIDNAGVEAILGDILTAIENNTAENENNLQCSQAKACDADCAVVICHTCYDVEGAIVSTSHTNADGSAYAGDTSTLDLGCVACGEPLPSYEILNVPVCFDDCTEGYNLIKVNTSDDTVTLLGTYNLDATVATATVVPCPHIQVVQEELCVVADGGDGVVNPNCADYNTTYSVQNNNTDISFSTNTTQMKWNQSTGGNPDGAQSFTQAVQDCIDAGGSATIDFSDPDGGTHQFVATAYSGAAGGNVLFTGTNNTESIAGKVTMASLSCQC